MQIRYGKAVISLALLLLLITGCTNSSPDKENNHYLESELLVTAQYGKEVLLNEFPETKGNLTVLDNLKSNAEVATSAQGNFVESINGIGSKKEADKGWFFYVNGISAAKGAGDLMLRDGDKVWWDYHGWDGVPLYNAVVGAYPEPFIKGINPAANQVTLLTTEQFKPLAVSLQNYLQTQGNDNIVINELSNEALANRPGPTIVIGLEDDISDLAYMAPLNDPKNRAGLNIWFDHNQVHLLDEKGQVQVSVTESCGILAAYDEGMGSKGPLWLVVGNNKEGLNLALELLTEKSDLIKGQYGVAVIAEPYEVISLPVQ